jgi:hypothetical protein
LWTFYHFGIYEALLARLKPRLSPPAGSADAAIATALEAVKKKLKGGTAKQRLHAQHTPFHALWLLLRHLQPVLYACPG